jgi:hypothetical protein
MSPSFEEPFPPLPSPTARGLSLAGVVLLVLFLSILAGALFPVSLLAPAWQLRCGAALINGSPVAITGLALLNLAASLDRADPLLARRRRVAARLAIPAALGFLLLVPLLSSAALRQQSDQFLQRTVDLRRASSQLDLLRQAARAASSVQELDQQLVNLRGPQLEPADRTLPLAEVRRRLDAVLNQAAGDIARQRSAIPPANPLQLLPELLRTTIACIALAIGFAALARRDNAEESLLEELQRAGIRR